jgi:tetratricopeptide (TPR) repeat protein
MSLRDAAARQGALGAARRWAAHGEIFMRMVLMALGAILAPALAAAPPLGAQTRADRNWIGRRVVQKSQDFVLRDDKQAILPNDGLIHIYRVERVDGGRLQLKAEGQGPSGSATADTLPPAIPPPPTPPIKEGPSVWAAADQVIPIDQAVAFFTERIRANPKDAFSYIMRATALNDDLEIDRALDDYGQAIRFDPKSASAYVGRAGMWRLRRQDDKAFADYQMAIRLDPQAAAVERQLLAWYHETNFDKAVAGYNEAIRQNPVNAPAYRKLCAAYRERGLRRYGEGEFDKEIADLTEAIRLDPKMADAYNNRGVTWRDKKEWDKAIADFDQAIRLDLKNPYPHYNRAVVLFLTHRDGAIEDARKVLDLQAGGGICRSMLCFWATSPRGAPDSSTRPGCSSTRPRPGAVPPSGPSRSSSISAARSTRPSCWPPRSTTTR